jgi:RNA polymerase sigma factor (sigma-70 family)
MKMPEITTEILSSAQGGDLLDLNGLLASIQPALFNLSMRILGNREDAQDACQEILLKITTHLGSFRGESSFGTWAYRVASNHLLSARTRSRETPEVSLDALQERLGQGVALVESRGLDHGRNLLPEEKLEARRIAIGCTQSMLMALDREHRLAYVLDTVFGLLSADAASVLLLSPAAYRKRLSRARRRLDDFMSGTCGLISDDAPCRCRKQAKALAFMKSLPASEAQAPASKIEPTAFEMASAEKELGDLMRMSDAAAIFRAHPQYQAPGQMIATIRAVLTAYDQRTQ